MKKLLLFIVLLFPIYCFAIEYTVLRDTTLSVYSSGNGFIKDIPAGETIFPADRPRIFSEDTKTMSVTTKEGVSGWIKYDDILLSNNNPLPEYVTNTEWVYSFYQDIILKGNRESLYTHEPFWQNEWGQGVEQYEYPGDWWKIFSESSFFIENNIFIIDYLYWGDRIEFLTKEQIVEDNKVTISVICTYKNENYPQHYLNRTFELNKEYTLQFVIDGDYMSVYLESSKICELIRGDEQFNKNVVSVIKNESLEHEITYWPRRANGSMDYPTPVDMSKYKTTHHTTDNLRLRDTPNTTSLIVTTLRKGSAVQVLETGAMQTIDGITAPWVKVLSETGYEGWCFSGYLREN